MRPLAVHLALYIASTLALAVLAALASGPPALETGGFIYALDDTYIHLAIGRTLATSGVWGTAPLDPAAASSSPLWSVLLASIYLLMPGQDQAFSWVPVILNVVAGSALISLWTHILSRVRAGHGWVFLLWALLSLGPLTLLGMEHVLHIALALALAWFATGHIARSSSGGTSLWGLGLLAGLSAAARYESLFLIAVLAALALVRGRWLAMLVLVVAGSIPVVAFGAIWILQGGWLLPNSLMLKGAGTVSSGFSGRVEALLLNFQVNFEQRTAVVVAVLVPIAALLALLPLAGFRPTRATTFAVAAIGTTILHLAFASLNWLFRYEAWLIALSGTALALLVADQLRGSRLAVGVSAALLAAVLAPRAFLATAHTVQAPADRVWEHFLPTAFVNQHYAGQNVIVNDLGVMAYYGRARTIDMFGLGHNEPIRLRQQPQGYDAQSALRFGKTVDARIAILQVCWHEVNMRLPGEWSLVGLWRGPRNVVFGDTLVGFFALDGAEFPKLSEALGSFALPPDVQLLDFKSAPVVAFNTSDMRAVAVRECRS